VPESRLDDMVARVLGALTTAWQVQGDPGPARAVADWTLEHLREDDGAVRDGPACDVALLDHPLYPLDTTVELADALLNLALLTGEDRYRDLAEDAVASYGAAGERMGVEVAHFATVAARLQSPEAIEVGEQAGSDLHRAALRLADHESVVVPDADCEGARHRVDGEIVGTADGPQALEDLLTGDK
jgi:uncharacterized protein YyaL (SSP411 family)